MNRNPVRPGRRRERRGKQAQHWLRAGILAGILLSLLMFAVSGAALGLQWSRYRQSEQLYQDLRTGIRDTASAGSGENMGGNCASQKDFSSLQAGSPDTGAWITGEDTPIDYPVVHTDNNEYYLSHLYSGEENRYGTLFADCRNTGLFTDPNTTDPWDDAQMIETIRHCDRHNVPIATNLASAEMLIMGLQRGDLDWREMLHNKTRY